MEDCILAAEGSFSSAWIASDYCLRFTPAGDSDPIVERVLQSAAAMVDCSLSCRIDGYGRVEKSSNSELVGVAIFMEKLSPLPLDYADEVSVFEALSRINSFGFHNDLKADNLMLSSDGHLRVIDFDFFHATSMIVSVTAFQVIALDIDAFLSSIESSESVTVFKTIYDYTYLSASLPGSHPLYGKVLQRLKDLFVSIKDSILIPLISYIGETRVNEIPIEVLVRCPGIDAVSVNVFDLAGNAYSHGIQDWESFPTLVKSNGVYWPS